MKIKDIYESSTTAGAITTGSPATIGKTQKRAGSLFQGKVTNKPFYEQEESETKKKKPKKDFGKMFQKKVDQSNKAKKDTEEKVKAHTVKEDEIVEQDLILVPGQIKGKDKSFIPHEKDRRDHEVEMARSELFAAAKDAQRIYAMLKNRTEDEGLMGWQQSYITLAADYLNSVADSLEHQAHMNEMTGGVIAGGMSNFEEGLEDEPPPEKGSLEYRALKRMKGPTQEDALEALVIEIGLDRFKRENKLYREYIPALMHHYKKQSVTEEQLDELKKSTINDYLSKSSAAVRGGRQEVPKKVPSWKVAAGKVNPNSELSKYAKIKASDVAVQEEQAPMFTPEEEQLDEKKDACYSKVKSRYKVWPSAYASGALVKCRKVGASNWGNKSKK
jgi:flagellar hook-basal body complex protein FliE